ncbi:hypothetical protein CLV25_10689 [Acetobacteroides hydrogenigenes]|uniref:Uncharacterized protein n=1 Tax=Acetobacteroides hydrogenigenes TaxID=979970 RepID=A0A4R2EJZ8_9BACT|nr:hypothetical protein CLV25_10689 [Acetobacteroides hydrogenigenes]
MSAWCWVCHFLGVVDTFYRQNFNLYRTSVAYFSYITPIYFES